MKKFLALALVLGSSVMFAPSAKAAETSSTLAIEANSAPQTYRQRQRWNRRARVVVRTRVVRVGFRTYRERVQYRYFPNGRVTVRVLSRTRIR